MKKFFNEFKTFISRGNVFDMAVGLIIATAFNKIVSSMVNDIIMPLVTWATGASSLADLSIPLRYTIVDGVKVVTLSWAYGNYIQTIIDFLIIAFSVFLMVKVMNKSKEKLKEINDLVHKEADADHKTAKRKVKAQAKAEHRKFKEVWAEYEANEKAKREQALKQAEADKKAKEEAEKLAHPTQEMLLTEIRDLLRNQNKK